TPSKNFAAPGKVNTRILSNACEIHMVPSERRRRNAPQALLRASAGASRIEISVFMLGISQKQLEEAGRADARPARWTLRDHGRVAHFERQRALLPFLLAAFVHRNVGIPELDQALRGDTAVLAAAARAIHDHGGAFVGDDDGGALVHLI